VLLHPLLRRGKERDPVTRLLSDLRRTSN